MNYRDFTDINEWCDYLDGESLHMFSRDIQDVHIEIYYVGTPHRWNWCADVPSANPRTICLHSNPTTTLTCFEAFDEAYRYLTEHNYILCESVYATRCPNCGSRNITFDKIKIDKGLAYDEELTTHEFSCNRCNCAWEVGYNPDTDTYDQYASML